MILRPWVLLRSPRRTTKALISGPRAADTAHVGQKTVVDEQAAVPVEDLIESVRDQISDLDDVANKISQLVEDSGASSRMEMAQTRRELVEMKAYIARLQSRVENQLMVLVLANIASGIGITALVLGATKAF
jgi:predicted  nucleic acid-binding Zn-ribbon protein